MEQVREFFDWLVAGDVADKEAYLAEKRAKAAAKRAGVVFEKGRSPSSQVAPPPITANRGRNRQSQVSVK